MTSVTFYSRCLKRSTSIFAASTDSCLSQRLLTYTGLIQPSSSGVFILLPPFVRVVDKLCSRINSKMHSIGAQQLLMPTLGSSHLWMKSGRWNKFDQMFKLSDHLGKTYCLQPTFEEEITALISTYEISEKNLPLLLYQISSKYRDELRPRFGLLRCREFLMKDLYSFDKDYVSAVTTYETVCAAYTDILTHLQVPFYKVSASTGHIGGHMSHEFQIPIPIGEDTIKICSSCGLGLNAETDITEIKEFSDSSFPSCTHSFTEVRAAEVGHCFLLGQRYSKVFEATHDLPTGKNTLEMGCFGLGLTRLIAACVEYLSASAFPNLSTDQITEIRWPIGLAPFSGAVALQKDSAKDAISADELTMIIDACSLGAVSHGHLDGDVLVDDRSGMSIGRKLVDLKRLGIPWILVAKSPKRSNQQFELIDVYRGSSHEASLHQVRDAFHTCNYDASVLPDWAPPDTHSISF